jgi:hypothetical protein
VPDGSARALDVFNFVLTAEERAWEGTRDLPMIRAKCARCGLTVAVTDIRRDGYSFQSETGASFSDLCPVAKEQKLRGIAPTEDACSHLGKAIRAEIHCRVLAEV